MAVRAIQTIRKTAVMVMKGGETLALRVLTSTVSVLARVLDSEPYPVALSAIISTAALRIRHQRAWTLTWSQRSLMCDDESRDKQNERKAYLDVSHSSQGKTYHGPDSGRELDQSGFPTRYQYLTI